MALILQQSPAVVLQDTLVADSLDSLNFRIDPVPSSSPKTIVLSRPPKPAVPLPDSSSSGISWLLSGMFLVFIIACLRYRKNSRFFSLMVRNVIEIRERHNAFDDTLRETSFVWLLNLLWCASAGVLLYGFIFPPAIGFLYDSLEIDRLLVCMGAALGYTLFMTLAYYVVGALFSDSSKASLWVRGYLSTQGLEAVFLFFIAMIALCVPGIFYSMVITGSILFLASKLFFIYKSFCIFFTETASWVLFLYYLCSLEIVPVVLTYVAAHLLCIMIG